MKTFARIIYTATAIIWLLITVTFMDITSHNSGPDHGNYWLPTTEAMVEWLEQHEAEQSASFSFGRSSASARQRRGCGCAAKTPLQSTNAMAAAARLKPSFSSTRPLPPCRG